MLVYETATPLHSLRCLCIVVVFTKILTENPVTPV